MAITRRTATIGSLSLLAGTSMSTIARADWDGPVYSAVEGGEEFWLATVPIFSSYQGMTWRWPVGSMTNGRLAVGAKRRWAIGQGSDLSVCVLSGRGRAERRPALDSRMVVVGDEPRSGASPAGKGCGSS